MTMKYTVVFAIFAICVMAAPKVEVKALVESLCPDCVYFTKTALKKLVETEDIMAITDLEIVPYGKAHIITRNPPTFTCQHGEPECYGNRVELCSLKYYPTSGLDLMNCMQENYSFDDATVKKCAEEMKVEAAPILTCASGEEGKQLMLRAGDITPKLSYVPSVLVNGKLFTDPENVVKHICNAYTGEQPASCKKNWKDLLCFN